MFQPEGAHDALAVGDGAGRHGDDDEPVRHQAGGLQSGFGHPDDRTGGDLAGRVDTGVAEAGDDECVGVGLVRTDLLDDADGGDGLLGVAFHARHALGRVHAGDIDAGCPRRPALPR